ncbi:diguanylate cyclase domain-containing protein [[Leptolyngbya] sp. PCC 7376]|uniref:sensor domain-containing diguanylate cyclase n=1 Tax=[Leptolyngbya] sp. PCC 7376 TaxID=111781 RepID=UPI000684AFAF|nr:diguanylate cyclase [[Leptolyngbya] sp. PCC 7376]
MTFSKLVKHPVFCQLAIAISYILAIKFSVSFASLPGELTPLWLPAVVGLIAILELGNTALIGIILGTSIENYFALNELSLDLSFSAILILTLAIVFNEAVNVFICATWLRRRHKSLSSIFQTVKSISEFLGISLISSSISALLPVFFFYVYGIIPINNLLVSWLVWFLGASLAQLIFVPPILFWRSPKGQQRKTAIWEIIVFVGLATLVSYFVFYKNYDLEYLFLPLLVGSVFRLEQPLPQVLVGILSLVGIFATVNGYGSFVGETPHPTLSLLLLESFIAVYAVTILIISAILSERKAITQTLHSTLDFLEERVFDRTSKLLQTQLVLDTFIDTAPLAMAILDKDLNLIKVNNFLADLQQRQESNDDIPEYIINPKLHQEIVSKCQLILDSKQENINEEMYVPDTNSGSTWLMSYFPIIDEQGRVFRVGFIGLDISDRKRLELILQKQAQLDGLTQIANRRKFDEVLEREWLRCQRDQTPLSLLIFDIDHFKIYNDTYGHVQGDECLIRIAQVLKKQIGRTTDLAARYGGEEFIILLSNTDLDGACYISKRTLKAIRELKIPHQNSPVIPFVTSSCGVATCIPNKHLDMAYLIDRADKALYQAKSQGRNQAFTIESEENRESA